MCMYPQNVPAWTSSIYKKAWKTLPESTKNNVKASQARMEVPCGKCPDCRKLRAVHWSFRLNEQMKESVNGIFLTLTYNDENLPYTDEGVETLHHPDCQLFYKKLRRATEYYYSKGLPKTNDPDKDSVWNALSETKIKYYHVGEYGGNTQRPHYHAIIFNVPLEIQKKIQKIWNQGNVKIGTVKAESIRYVANYLMVNKQDKAIRCPEYAAMSQGLGLTYFEKNESVMRKQVKSTIRYNDSEVPMPKYYLDKVFNRDERDHLAEKNKNAYQARLDEQLAEWKLKGLNPKEETAKINSEKIRKFLKNKKTKL